MGDIFRLWRTRLDEYARRAVDAYQVELPEYRTLAANPPVRTAMLDFAVFLRRRTVDLAANNEPFADNDLELMASMGRQRGERGLSLAAERRVLLLHSRLTLSELGEVAGPDDIDATMQAIAWLGPAGLAAQGAYTRGYLEGQERFLPAVSRVKLLVTMLLANDAAAPELARSLKIALPADTVLTVIRIADAPIRPAPLPGEEVVEALLRRHWLPITWNDPDELLVLLPDEAHPIDPAERALSLARDVAEFVGRPCAVGAAHGRAPALTEALALARQVARAAPAQAKPHQVYTAADLFVELGAARLPQVDQWLREVARRLTAGPDLIITLDAYYRADMNRARAAAALHIHPRTLDYRLQRVRDLAGLEPGSTQGVRVLSTTVARALADP